MLLQSRQNDTFSQIPSLSLFKEHKQLVQHSLGFLYPFKHDSFLVVYTYIKKNGNEEIMTTSFKSNNDSIAKEKKEWQLFSWKEASSERLTVEAMFFVFL